MRKRDFDRLMWIHGRNFETIKSHQWPVHMHTNYAPWVHFFSRLVAEETGLEEFPDIEIHFAPQNADHMRRIRMVIEKPRRIEIEVLIDRGDETYAPFFRELHVTAELKTKAPCALWVTEGEWDGVRDVTVRLNESEKMQALLGELRLRRPMSGDGSASPNEVPPNDRGYAPGGSAANPKKAVPGKVEPFRASGGKAAKPNEKILPLAPKPTHKSPDVPLGRSLNSVGPTREIMPGHRIEWWVPPPPVWMPEPFREAEEPAELSEIPEWLNRPGSNPNRRTLYDLLRHHKGFLITRKEAENELCFVDPPVQRGPKRRIKSSALERLRAVRTQIKIEPRTRMRSMLHAVVRLDDNQFHLGDVLNLVNEAEAVIGWRPPRKPSWRTIFCQKVWAYWSKTPGAHQEHWNALVDIYGGDWRANDRAWRMRPYQGTTEKMWQFIESRKDWKIHLYGGWIRPPRAPRKARGRELGVGGWGKPERVKGRKGEGDGWRNTSDEEEVWNGPPLGLDADEYFWPPGERPDRTRAN